MRLTNGMFSFFPSNTHLLTHVSATCCYPNSSTTSADTNRYRNCSLFPDTWRNGLSLRRRAYIYPQPQIRTEELCSNDRYCSRPRCRCHWVSSSDYPRRGRWCGKSIRPCYRSRFLLGYSYCWGHILVLLGTGLAQGNQESH